MLGTPLTLRAAHYFNQLAGQLVFRFNNMRIGRIWHVGAP